MIDPIERPKGSLSADQSFDLLQELEANTTEAVRRVRSHERLAIKSKLIVEPGNVTDRRTLKVQGVTGDISSGGLQALLPLPLQVGDIYRLTFDAETLGLPVTFARCLRCRLIGEEAFESGFMFFAPLDLSRLTGGGDANAA